MTRYLCFPILILVFAGCASSVVRNDTEKGVLFIVPMAPVEWFLKDTNIRVRVTNAEQIERMEKNLNLICYRYYNALKKATVINCPQGIEYLEVTQEEFLFPVKEISETIEVRSKTVKVGERYKLSVVGQYKDGCNALSTSANSTAYSETVTFSHADSTKSDLEEIYWSKTFIACD